MTNKDALIAVISLPGVSDTLIDKSLLDADVTSNATYTKDVSKSIDLVAIEVLKSLISLPDISEGDFSVRYNKDAVKDRLNFLYEKNGLSESFKPVVKGVSPW